MKLFIGGLVGLVLSVHVGAEPLLEGRVRLSSGQPVAGVQVRLFDLTDLRRFVGTTTDEAGHFALPLRAFSTARGTALPTSYWNIGCGNTVPTAEDTSDLKSATGIDNSLDHLRLYKNNIRLSENNRSMSKLPVSSRRSYTRWATFYDELLQCNRGSRLTQERS